MNGSDRSRPKDCERALVVDARSEKDNEDHSSECQWSGVFKKGFDRADTVRDYR